MNSNLIKTKNKLKQARGNYFDYDKESMSNVIFYAEDKKKIIIDGIEYGLDLESDEINLISNIEYEGNRLTISFSNGKTKEIELKEHVNEIVRGDDLNDITDTGLYSSNAQASIMNKPSEDINYFTLSVINTQNKQITSACSQLLINTENNEVWSRIKHNHNWSAWKSLEYKDGELGGRNYIQNSNFKDGIREWNTRASSVEFLEDPELGSYARVDAYTSGGLFQVIPKTIKDNEPYTVSFMVRSKGENAITSLNVGMSKLEDVRLTEGWERVQATTFKVRGNMSMLFYTNEKGVYDITNIQLERGKNASEWDYSYEDKDLEKKEILDRITKIEEALELNK